MINKAKNVKKLRRIQIRKATFRRMLKDSDEVSGAIHNLMVWGVLTPADRDNLYRSLRNDLLAAYDKLPVQSDNNAGS